MQINLTVVQEWLIKNWSKIALVISLFFLFKSCQSGAELKVAKTEIENHKKLEKKYLADAKKLEYEKSQFIDTIKFLDAQNQKKQVEIVVLNKKVNAKLNDIKHYNSSDIANYYKDRYNLPKEVKTTNLGTALTDTVARLNISDLVVGDGAKAELKITKNVLENTEKIVVQKDSVIGNVEKQNNLLFLANNESDLAFDKQKGVIKSVEKSLKAERNKKRFWQLATGVITGVGIYLIAK